MEILVSSINREIEELIEKKVKFNVIGNIEVLPEICKRELKEAIKKTEHNNKVTLTLALSYSARWDIANAAKKIASLVKSNDLNLEDINENMFGNYLNTHNLPDPELMIRTSGEHRISNYLLWELAYAELYFTSKLWPDFRREDLFEAIYDYQKRERRFGLTSEQIG
jgi:undecaprenyl diphosphate synthase